MTTIFLARHGQTDWNAERRWQGHADPPLNHTGRAEARALGERLRSEEIERIYSSDLARARETAELVGSALGLPVELDARLREVDVGEWSGLTTAEVVERYPEGYRQRRAGGTGWATGETFEAMGERVLEGLREIAARHPGGLLLVVTHGGPLRVVSATCRGPAAWVSASNCDYDVVAVEAGEMRWIHSNRGGLHEQVQG